MSWIPYYRGKWADARRDEALRKQEEREDRVEQEAVNAFLNQYLRTLKGLSGYADAASADLQSMTKGLH